MRQVTQLLYYRPTWDDRSSHVGRSWILLRYFGLFSELSESFIVGIIHSKQQKDPAQEKVLKHITGALLAFGVRDMPPLIAVWFSSKN